MDATTGRATADLVDDYRDSGRILACQLQFRDFGGRPRFAGRVQTVRTFEDNARVREALGQPGEGGVLVIDGGGSLRTALMGDQVAELLVRNNWSGAIIHGAIRDAVAMAALPIGIKALGVTPWPPAKLGIGEIGATLRFGNAVFAPGNWVYADEDGVLVADGELA